MYIVRYLSQAAQLKYVGAGGVQLDAEITGLQAARIHTGHPSGRGKQQFSQPVRRRRYATDASEPADVK